MTPTARTDPETLLAQLDALLGPPPVEDPTAPLPPRPRVFPLPPPAPVAAPAPEPLPAPVLPPPEPACEDAPAPRRPAPRVLIVEDNKDYRKVLKYVLASRGYSVSEAGDGAEGLKLARARPPDLAILDFEMPRMNGYELLLELRRAEETRRLPVVFLSGAVNRRQLRDVAVDVARVLEKPVSNETLLDVVHDLLGPPPVVEEPAQDESAAPALVETPAQTPAGPTTLEELPPDDEDGDDDLLIEDQKKAHEDEVSGLDVLANDSPLVNRINRILVRAVEMGASDVHIEPQEKLIYVRVRVNACRFQNACPSRCRPRSPPASRSWPTSSSRSAGAPRTGRSGPSSKGKRSSSA